MIYFALGGKYVAIAHKEHCVTQLWFMSSLFILDYINNWPSVVSTNFGDNKFSLLVAVINTMFYLYPSMLAVCSFVLFTLRARVVFSNSSLLRISFWFSLPHPPFNSIKLDYWLGCTPATFTSAEQAGWGPHPTLVYSLLGGDALHLLPRPLPCRVCRCHPHCTAHC